MESLASNVSPLPFSGTSSPRRELQSQYQLFSVMWAVASLATAYLRFSETYAAGLLGVGIDANTKSVMAFLAAQILASLVTLLRPTWTMPLVISGLLHVVFAAWALPNVHSSDVLWMFFGLAITVSFLSGLGARRSYSLGSIGVFRSVAPCLRGMTVIAIAAVGLARANEHFLNVASSPVASLVDRMLGVEQLAILNVVAVKPSLRYLTMSALVLVDLSLALLLLVPSWRRFAIGFGSSYYVGQAILGIGESRWLLPVFLFGLLTYASPTLMNRIVQTLAGTFGWFRRVAIYFAALSVIALFVMFGWSQLTAPGHDLFSTFNTTVSWLGANWIVVSERSYLIAIIVWLLFLVSCLVEAHPRRTRVSMLPRNALHYGLFLAMLLVVASPYLGLGDVGRFSDFSGLANAGGSRHLLIPHVDVLRLEGDGRSKEMSSGRRWFYRKLFTFHSKIRNNDSDAEWQGQ